MPTTGSVSNIIFLSIYIFTSLELSQLTLFLRLLLLLCPYFFSLNATTHFLFRKVIGNISSETREMWIFLWFRYSNSWKWSFSSLHSSKQTVIIDLILHNLPLTGKKNLLIWWNNKLNNQLISKKLIWKVTINQLIITTSQFELVSKWIQTIN